MGIGSVLGSVTLQAGDQVKSQRQFTDYYAGFGFYGQLTTFNTNEMYTVKLGGEAELSISGAPVSLPMSITLNDGW